MQKSTDITWHNHTVTKADRVRKNGYKPCVIWFTGLSASGKSTLANALAARLFEIIRHMSLTVIMLGTASTKISVSVRKIGRKISAASVR